jgi:hypothetical protein
MFLYYILVLKIKLFGQLGLYETWSVINTMHKMLYPFHLGTRLIRERFNLKINQQVESK